MNVLYRHALRACLLSLAWLAIAAHAEVENAANGLSLQQAVAAALERNPALQTFDFRFRALDARAQQAALRPATGVSLDVENIAGSGDLNGIDGAEATLALSQVIELGGKREARIGTTEASRSALETERWAAQLDVLAEVTRRFIAVAQRQKGLQLTRDAVALAEKTVEASERRVNAAKAPHAEFDRARILLDRARLDEHAALADLDAARKQLAATWGESQPVINGQLFGEVLADLFILPPTGDFRVLVQQLAHNPNFLRYASEARLLDAELRLASTLRRPDITLGAGLRRLEESKDQAFVVSLAVPLRSSRRAESFVAEARANRELVDAERRAAEVKAQATLYELHRQLSRAVSEATTLRDDIKPRSAEALEETAYGYRRGRYSYLELVDAQREYLAVQEALISAAASAHGLRTEIERLTSAPLSTP